MNVEHAFINLFIDKEK